MIILYLFAFLLLGVARVVVSRRAAALEKKYVRVASATENLSRDRTLKEGNGNRFDACQAAKRYYLLGQLVQQRDRLEARHHAWQTAVEQLGRLRGALRSFLGPKLSYTFGALDLAAVSVLIDYLTSGQCDRAEQLQQLVAALLAR